MRATLVVYPRVSSGTEYSRSLHKQRVRRERFFPESKTQALQFVKDRVDGWLHGVTSGCTQRLAGLVAFAGDSNQQNILWAGTEHVGGHEAL
jgi:hypothetical protein